MGLGRSHDLADASAVLGLVRACRKTLRPQRSRTGPGRAVREALWYLWEEPRLPRPLIASKYPRRYPWSPGAQATFEANGGERPQGGWGLVIEHLYPRELLVAELLKEKALNQAPAMVDLLTQRLMAAVITREEDRLLPTRAQAPTSWTAYESDPWSRYHSAGIVTDRYVPLPD